jgi:hypothetical protein
MRLVAVKNVDPAREDVSLEVAVEGGQGKKAYDPRVVLVLDWWGLVPRR